MAGPALSQLVLALSTGLLGGFGHCAGMCGPIVSSVSLVAAPRLGPRRALGGQLLYNAGRVTSYACLGGLMGLTGSFVNTAGRLAGLQDAVGVIAGALMVLLGLAAAGLAPPLRRLESRLGGPVLRAVEAVLGEGAGAGRFYALGLLLGFLPCGLSYWAFMGAAATGGLPQGFAFALAFALGTVPALLLVGGLSALATARLRGALYRLGGVVAAAVGAWLLLRGLGVRLAL